MDGPFPSLCIVCMVWFGLVWSPVFEIKFDPCIYILFMVIIQYPQLCISNTKDEVKGNILQYSHSLSLSLNYWKKKLPVYSAGFYICCLPICSNSVSQQYYKEYSTSGPSQIQCIYFLFSYLPSSIFLLIAFLFSPVRLSLSPLFLLHYLYPSSLPIHHF